MEHFYRTLPGLCTFEDYYAWVAAEAARTEKETGNHWHGVEVGVYGGQSAAFLAVELFNRGLKAKLDLVDEFRHAEAQLGDVLVRLKPVKDVIGTVHQGLSWDMAARYGDATIDFCFIDTDHTYAVTKKEIAAWLPKIKSGGVMSGHDYSPHFPGVIDSVTEAFPCYEIWRGRNDHPDVGLNGKYMPVWSARIH